MNSKTRSWLTVLSLHLVLGPLAGCDSKNEPGDTGDVDDSVQDTSPGDTAEEADVPQDGEDADLADTLTELDAEDLACVCGNGVHQLDCGEQCDDGNYENSDDCLSNCVIATCGDGVVRSLPASTADVEECDDGNDVAGDGCEDDCTYTCHDAADCDDGDICTLELCDGAYHVCDSIPGSEGEPCGGDLCTGLGTCMAGTCVNADPLDCDDGEQCTTDSCDPVVGCVHTPVAEGTPCDDGFFCWTDDQCIGPYGFCSGVPVHPCGDGDPCTIDTCNEFLDTCSHETPVYRMVTCGSTERSSTFGRASTYGDYVCPDGAHVASTPDEILEMTISGPTTLSVTIDTDVSIPGTEMYLLVDACDVTTCLSHSSDSMNHALAAGTYYLVVETPGSGGTYQLDLGCP